MNLSKKRAIILGSLLAILIIPATIIWFVVAPYRVEPLTKEEILLYNADPYTVVIYPIFTQAAYSKHGFYSYYNKTCGINCLTVSFTETKIQPSYNTGKFSYLYMKELNYTILTDIDIDHNPKLLDKYHRVILLHNEYVTQTEFEAIQKQHVIYLYPNSLYAKVSVNYENHTITLLRGHGYPDPKILNGFDWEFDNTKDEYNIICSNWHFSHIPNGFQLDCYPEMLIAHDRQLLSYLQKD